MELLPGSSIELGAEVASFWGILPTWVTPLSKERVEGQKKQVRIEFLHTSVVNVRKNNHYSFSQMIYMVMYLL